MDLTTVLGIGLGFVLISLSILDGSSLSTFIDVPSMLVVLGGTLAAVLVQFPAKQVFSIIALIGVAFRGRESQARELIHEVVEFAKKARREGLLAMEQEVAEHPNEFLRKGVQLVVDGTEPELVRSIMEIDLAAHEERHALGQEVLRAVGAYAPAFGMLGTVIGLIQMLAQLDDPEAIGPGMALALITTFYGVVLANLVFLPMAGKLRFRSQQERLERELIIEGVSPFGGREPADCGGEAPRLPVARGTGPGAGQPDPGRARGGDRRCVVGVAGRTAAGLRAPPTG